MAEKLFCLAAFTQCQVQARQGDVQTDAVLVRGTPGIGLLEPASGTGLTQAAVLADQVLVPFLLELRLDQRRGIDIVEFDGALHIGGNQRVGPLLPTWHGVPDAGEGFAVARFGQRLQDGCQFQPGVVQAIQQLASRDVEERLDQVRSLVGNGVLLPGEERVLLAEQIRFQQELERMEGDLRIGYRALELLLGVEFPEDTSLQLQLPGPLAPPPDSGQPNVTASSGYAGRPEFDLFDARQAMLDARKEAFSAGMLPTLALFGRSFYGRPGFNVFNDDLQLNWIVGIRAQWSLSGTRNASLRRDATELQKRSIHTEREAFTRQLQTEWSRLEEEMQTLRRQISQDEEVVELRQEITGEKRKLLEQGVITSTEYLTELHAEQRARLNLEIRKIRLAQIRTEYQTQRGAYDSRL